MATIQEWPVLGVTYVAEFPTPNLDDKYLYVMLDSKGTGFVMPELGTLHPDKKKWPDYIVSLVAPNKQQGDGIWIVVYSKDREDQDDYNASITYPYGDTDYPRITREYIYRQSEYTVLPEGTADSVYAGAVLIEPDKVDSATGDPVLDGLYVKVTRVFEILPGPSIIESDYDEFTRNPVLVTKQIVLQSTVPTTVAELAAEMNAYGSVAMTSIGPAGTTCTASAVHGLTVGQEIYFSGMSGLTTFINGDATGVGAYYVKTIPTDSTFTCALLPGGSAVSGSATGGTLYKRTLARGTIIEYKAMGFDKYRSIKITSQMYISEIDWVSGAADLVYPSVINHSFPDELISADWIGLPGDFNGGNNNTASMLVNIREGYRGPCVARITERFTSNPYSASFLAALPTPTTFAPQAHSVPYWPDPVGSFNSESRFTTFNIPATIHPQITVTVLHEGGATETPIYSPTIAATSGTTTVGTGYHVIGIEPERGRFGMWRYRIIEAKAPV
jgi:hypothetical protein